MHVDLCVSTQSVHLSLNLCTHMNQCVSAYICVAAGLLVCVCSDVLVRYLIKALLSPGELSIPIHALELEQRPLQNKCKQLRATSVSIRETDNSCEQGL